jgi:D-3-phosphoglycerate dehydrogenase
MSQRFPVLVTALHWLPEAQQIVRDAGGELVFMPDPVDEAALLERFAAAPIAALVLRGSKPVTARVLAAAPALRVIAKNGAGVDSVDLPEATRRGIAVMVAAGANADAVAEHALALMLSLRRGLPTLDRKVRAGGWEGTAYQGRDFRGARVGIVGFGSIGRATARLANALGACVVVLRRAGGALADGFDVEPDLDRLLRDVDILSLHCPLTDATRGLIGRRELALMKPDAVLVNTARGPVVDEPALIAALAEGRLAGAGLDTFDAEPLPDRHPFLELPNVILTPHVAGVTRNAAAEVAKITATNIADRLASRPLVRGNLVNPEVLEHPAFR